jgi:hypothetical protein
MTYVRTYVERRKGHTKEEKGGDNIGRWTYDRGKVIHEQMDRDICMVEKEKPMTKTENGKRLGHILEGNG